MSKSSIVIRRALPADLPEIQRLNRALFQYEHDHGFYGDTYNLNWPYEPAGIKYFTDCLGPSSDRAAFIAESDGRAVGYLAGSFATKAYRSLEGPMGELDNMFVEDAHRHTHVGTQLFAAFKIWLLENHVDRVGVSAFAQNASALQFYRGLGYQDSAITLEMPLT